MKIKFHLIVSCLLVFCLPHSLVTGQNTDSTWTLQKCIRYALQQNIQVRKSSLTTEIDQVNAVQAKAARFPSLSASVNQNFTWNRSVTNNNKYGDYSGSNGTTYALNSGVTLFSGGKISRSIRQSETELQASEYTTEAMKEDISLQVMDAYLQVLYAGEQVKNSKSQLETTTEQLRLAQERVRLGAISNADYLQVKSQAASESLTLADAENLLAIDRVNLMQLLELPVTNNFFIAIPEFGDSVNQNRNPDASSVFNTAMGIKPQIKSAGLNQQSAQLEVEIARANYFPDLSLNGQVSTGYSSTYPGMNYDYQVRNRVTPSLGLTLSVPIFGNKVVQSQVAIAKIGTITAELDANDTKNRLRKSIEQSCVDVVSAQKKYEAGLQAYQASAESHQVALEKFNQGLLNSVDYLVQKTNLITAQSTLLQAKYNLIFSYKVLDFYTGVALSL